MGVITYNLKNLELTVIDALQIVQIEAFVI